jgi:hypothetical protein
MAELGGADVDAWRNAARACPVPSPFFDPDVVRALCVDQPGARIAVDRTAASFAVLPFSVIDGHGRPWASGRWGTLADHQGIIGTHDPQDWFPHGSTRRLGVRSLLLDHLCVGTGYEAWATSTSTSPRIDLTDGYATFLERRRNDGSGLAAWLRRKRSLATREVGEVTFSANVTGAARDAAFHQLRSWKSAQYRRSGVADLFADGWVCAGLERLGELPDDAPTSAPLAVLSIDGSPAAVHLGVATDQLVHWWLPAYDPAMARYSPGALLLAAVCEWAASTGRRTVDLGRGDEEYKQRFANAAIPLSRILIRPDGWRRAFDVVRISFPQRDGVRAT